MARNERKARIPNWVTAPAIIALVLIGIVVTAMLAGNLGAGDDPGQMQHGPSGEDAPSADVTESDGGGEGGHRPPGGDHG